MHVALLTSASPSPRHSNRGALPVPQMCPALPTSGLHPFFSPAERALPYPAPSPSLELSLPNSLEHHLCMEPFPSLDTPSLLSLHRSGCVLQHSNSVPILSFNISIMCNSALLCGCLVNACRLHQTGPCKGRGWCRRSLTGRNLSVTGSTCSVNACLMKTKPKHYFI